MKIWKFGWSFSIFEKIFFEIFWSWALKLLEWISLPQGVAGNYWSRLIFHRECPEAIAAASPPKHWNLKGCWRDLRRVGSSGCSERCHLQACMIMRDRAKSTEGGTSRLTDPHVKLFVVSDPSLVPQCLHDHEGPGEVYREKIFWKWN